MKRQVFLLLAILAMLPIGAQIRGNSIVVTVEPDHHVATSTVDKLIDYCMNTPEDGYITAASVETIKKLIAKNRQ